MKGWQPTKKRNILCVLAYIAHIRSARITEIGYELKGNNAKKDLIELQCTLMICMEDPVINQSMQWKPNKGSEWQVVPIMEARTSNDIR